MPPLLGWTSITNQIEPFPLILFLIIFLWTPPHFWALAVYKYEDYKKAAIPMLPVTHGCDFTRLHIFLYSILLFCITLFPYLLGLSGLIYLIISSILSGYYLFISYKLLRAKHSVVEKKLATKLFGYSILYLFMIFATVLVDKVI